MRYLLGVALFLLMGGVMSAPLLAQDGTEPEKKEAPAAVSYTATFSGVT